MSDLPGVPFAMSKYRIQGHSCEPGGHTQCQLQGVIHPGLGGFRQEAEPSKMYFFLGE